MYNRYIPGADDCTASGGAGAVGWSAESEPWKQKAGASGGEDKNAGIAGILKSLHLEELDSGDILLLLILLLVFLEGDNIELVITLGLMLLLGLWDEKNQKE